MPFGPSFVIGNVCAPQPLLGLREESLATGWGPPRTGSARDETCENTRDCCEDCQQDLDEGSFEIGEGRREYGCHKGEQRHNENECECPNDDQPKVVRDGLIGGWQELTD